MTVKILTCKLLTKTLDKYKTNKKVVEAFKAFVKQKTEQPTQPFGKTDYAFKVARDLMHAHLTQDVSVIYSVSGRDPTLLKLYGVFSHQDSGTGTPANNNKLSALVDKIHGQEMTTS